MFIRGFWLYQTCLDFLEDCVSFHLPASQRQEKTNVALRSLRLGGEYYLDFRFLRNSAKYANPTKIIASPTT
jgi:hypothetical protein